ncbi:hypothetical protein DNTS_022733 [Danionella cerebrum]|uniref:Transcription cofactor HES-6 n=1 Tax=Danionella cerebrum TaxID=2873325 RepID=A0A553MY53_9TELE|nr:hypothetical protein DNTS_022733 [Danionella translucida]
MAPVARLGNGLAVEEDAFYAIKGDRKTRKPIVEKKRRARMNESLQDLRTLLSDSDAKMENAEVLELTVKRVESILQSRSQAAETENQEASERFAAGYIQCMHEVHTFVSTCPGIDTAVAAELLNHLLECMPLNDEHLQEMIMELISEPPSSSASRPVREARSPGVLSEHERCSSTPNASSDELCSDLEEGDAEGSSGPIIQSKLMWRPW